MRNRVKEAQEIADRARALVLAVDKDIRKDEEFANLIMGLIDALMDTLEYCNEENRKLRAELRGGSIQ